MPVATVIMLLAVVTVPTTAARSVLKVRPTHVTIKELVLALMRKPVTASERLPAV